MKKLTLYTDGMCHPNPGKGSYAGIVYDSSNMDFKFIVGGISEETTNNRMEVQAVISALKYIPKEYEIEIFSDSQYMVNVFQKNWHPKVNLDLWLPLLLENQKRNISWNWVKGHSSNHLNNLVDSLCQKFYNENIQEQLLNLNLEEIKQESISWS